MFSHVIRGFLYGLTSIGAIGAGYIIKGSYDPKDLLVLVVPVLASIFFFMCYSAHFPIPDQPFEDDNDQAETATLWRLFRANVFGYALFFIPTSAFVLHLANDYGISLISLPILSVFLQASLYFGYGIYLWIQARRKVTVELRHQIVWPVILAIGLSLYNGLIYSTKDASWHILIPVFVLLGVFVLTTFLTIKFRQSIWQFRQKPFLIFTLSVFFVSTSLALYFRGIEISEYVLTMLFCIIVSAYLAVFEAWKITADLCKPNRQATRIQTSQRASFSRATLWVAMVSVWALPFFFVFTDYGLVFLIPFGLHASVTLLLWYYFGDRPTMQNGSWRLHKFWAGVTFLVILAAGSIWKNPPDDGLLTGSAFGVVLGLMILGFASIITILLFDMRAKNGVFADVFADWVNFPRFLCFLCGAGAFVIIIITDRYTMGSSVRAKGQYAFTFYALTMLICFIVEGIQQVKSMRPGTPVAHFIYGFLVLIRAVTSLIIGLVVFLPSIYSGQTIPNALLRSLPFVLSAAGGFALNDYFDVEKDSITKPYRTLPSGTFSHRFVFRFACLSIAAAALFAIFAARDVSEFTLYFLCISGVATYNFFVKYLSLSKTLLTSLVSSIPVLFTTYSLGYPSVYLLLPVATCFFILGREWLMDIRDMQGDSLGGTTTIPMILGVTNTAILGVCFQFFAASLLIPIAIAVGSTLSIIVVASIFAILIVSAPFWTFRSGIYQRSVVQFLWLPMFLGILLFVC